MSDLPPDDASNLIFTTTLRGRPIAADPLIIRHKLLELTQGRAWILIPHWHDAAKQIQEAEQALNDLRQDLLDNPPTEEEKNPPPPAPPVTVKEGELPPPTPPIPLTRVQMLEVYQSKIAIALQQQSAITTHLAWATSQAFDLPEFDAETRSGYTCEEFIDLLIKFMDYAEKKSKV